MDTHSGMTSLGWQVVPDLTRWQCQSCGISAPSLLVLPTCGHVFCAPCVDQWLWTYISEQGGQNRHYPCQTCAATYRIPPDGLDAFLQNVHVLRLQLQLDQLTMATNEHLTIATDANSPSSSMESEHCSTPRLESRREADIMQDMKAARSGDFVSMDNNRCAMLPFASYCRLPNHLF